MTTESAAVTGESLLLGSLGQCGHHMGVAAQASIRTDSEGSCRRSLWAIPSKRVKDGQSD